METIITAATIMTMYLNSLGNVNSQYCYNADIENGQVKTMYVMTKNGESLNSKLEYRFAYDNMGRLTGKEASRYNPVTGHHEPEYRIDYTYTACGYSMERSKWNSSKKCFDRPDCRTDYRKELDSVVSVTNYKWNENKNEMLITDNLLIMTQADDFLLAEKK